MEDCARAPRGFEGFSILLLACCWLATGLMVLATGLMVLATGLMVACCGLLQIAAGIQAAISG